MESMPEGRLGDVFQGLNREHRLSSSLTVLFSQAVAAKLGVHSTDIETVDLLHMQGPMTAGQLAELTGLTSGATTRLIDRMEKSHFARRRADEHDRRRVVVEATLDNYARVFSLFQPVGSRMAELWSTYTVEQLEIVLDFMRKTNLILAEENARLRGLAPPPEPPRPASTV